MEELKTFIQQVDDDYLIGLSNKGTVKRAYKDLEQQLQLEAEIQTSHFIWNENNIKVTLKEETCTICKPLGESTCSCPSKSICRHIITAILWIKKAMESEIEADFELEDTEDIDSKNILEMPAKSRIIFAT